MNRTKWIKELKQCEAEAKAQLLKSDEQLYFEGTCRVWIMFTINEINKSIIVQQDQLIAELTNEIESQERLVA